MPRRYLIDVPGGEEETGGTATPPFIKYMVYFTDEDIAKNEFKELASIGKLVYLVRYALMPGGAVTYKKAPHTESAWHASITPEFRSYEEFLLSTHNGIGTSDLSALEDGGWSYLIVDKTDFERFEILADSRELAGSPEERDYIIADIMHTINSMTTEEVDLVLKWLRPVFNMGILLPTHGRRVEAIQLATKTIPLYYLKELRDKARAVYEGDYSESEAEAELPLPRRAFYNSVEELARSTLVKLWKLMAEAYPRLHILTQHPVNLETVARRTLINRILNAASQLSPDELTELNIAIDDLIAMENPEQLRVLIMDAIDQQIGEMDPQEPMEADEFLADVINLIKQLGSAPLMEFEQGGRFPPVEWGAVGSSDIMAEQIRELLELLDLADLQDVYSFASAT